jgi:DNA-binding CsgD family transcriptional regulator
MPVALEKRVLSLLGELIGLTELDEFCDGLLHALREAVPSDWSALNEVPAELPDTVSISEPAVPLELHQTFARYATQNPIAAYFLRTRDGRATRISDLITRRHLHQLDLYQHVYQELRIEYQIAFTLPSEAARILGVVLSRERRDFTARERDLLNLARPYLIQLYRNALTHTEHDPNPQLPLSALQGLGLTRRQAQVLRLVAAGATSRQAAARLEITPRTAQKHLEHCYRTLGVTNRTDAARAARDVVARTNANPAS